MANLRINEIFVSVQGEGVNTGVPAIFIRLAGCNLACTFCDTKYAWNNGREITIEEFTAKITEVRDQYPRVQRIVITGGEPLLQQEVLQRYIDSIVENVFENYIPIEIETNGSIDTKLREIDQYNISLKLSSSGNKKYYDPKILKSYIEQASICWKFVVDSPKDIKEIEEIVEELEDKITWSIYHDIIIMPQGTTAEELDSKALWIIPECIKRGWRFSDRLHIRVLKGKKGV